MSELTLLRVLLLVSMAIAPLGTHRFLLAPSRASTLIHLGALACAAIGLFSEAPVLCIGWLLFTLVSALQFAYARRASLFSVSTIAAGVPFVFSNVAALWVVGGANDLGLLGYGPFFSYYAALHGTVLGWIVVGAIAILAEHDPPRRHIYIAAILVGFASFLLIAFGIDKLRPLKTVGIVGLSIALPVAQLAFLRGARSRAALALGCLSLVGLVLTMLLAWRNELALTVAPAFGIRGMVSLHGALNVLVTAPCFLFAVVLAARRARPAPAA